LLKENEFPSDRQCLTEPMCPCCNSDTFLGCETFFQTVHWKDRQAAVLTPY